MKSKAFQLMTTNWGGSKCVLNEKSIACAEAFVQQLFDPALPRATILFSGNVLLAWHTGKIYIELEFLETKKVAYAAASRLLTHVGELDFNPESPSDADRILNHISRTHFK